MPKKNRKRQPVPWSTKATNVPAEMTPGEVAAKVRSGGIKVEGMTIFDPETLEPVDWMFLGLTPNDGTAMTGAEN